MGPAPRGILVGFSCQSYGLYIAFYEGASTTTRISVSSAVLEWAIQRSGKSINTLRNRFPALDDWRSGAKKPTLNQLRQFATTTFTPLGYLFLETPPVETLPVPHFRTHDPSARSYPSANLLDTVFAMQRRQTWAREYLHEQGQVAVPLVGWAEATDPPGATAERLRALLGLERGWAHGQNTWEGALLHLVEVLEAQGVMVVLNGVVANNTSRILSVAEFRGFALADDYAPLIFVNGADAKGAQLFTIAHELAHLAFGTSAAFDLRNLLPSDDPTERACNDVAAEFLVPSVLLRAYWAEIRHQEDWAGLISRRFKVSRIVALRRTLDLHLITRREFFNLYNDWSLQEHSTKKARGGDFMAMQRHRVGTLFGRLVASAVAEEVITYPEAFGLTDLRGSTFDHFTASVHRVAGRP